MNVLLMHPDRDFSAGLEPWQAPTAQDLVRDLELNTLWRAMAGDDAFVFNVASRALMAATDNDVATIRHRQAVARDAIRHPETVRQIYLLLGETLEKQRHGFNLYGAEPSSVLHNATGALGVYVEALRQLRLVARAQRGNVSSEGFVRLFAMLEKELGDDYLDGVRHQLDALHFRRGMLLGAELGPGCRGRRYTVRVPTAEPGWLHYLGKKPPSCSFRLDERDEAAGEELARIEAQALDAVADMLARAAARVERFLVQLRTELAFYLGCINLQHRLAALAAPVCLPTVAPASAAGPNASGLYDVCLALQLGRAPVGNALPAGPARAILIAGAGQGGKTSLLRAIGQAQLMMQCGLPVAADSFDAPPVSGVFSHFPRDEGRDLHGGHFDHELQRLNAIVDKLQPGALVLCDESLSATNEREGSEIAGQVLRALIDGGMRIAYVTHFHRLVADCRRRYGERCLPLLARSGPAGTRDYLLRVGEPQPDGYGAEVYARVFGSGS